MRFKKIIDIVFIIPLLLSATHATSFEFHEIKSGMTKVEIIKNFRLEEAAQAAKKKHPYLHADHTVDELVEKMVSEGIKPYELDQAGVELLKSNALYKVRPYFTESDVLWRVDLLYRTQYDILKNIALEDALQSHFKSEEIVKENETSKYGSNSFFRVTLVDKE